MKDVLENSKRENKRFQAATKAEKTVIIGDIHGRTIWNKIVNDNLDADKIIFIGDYVDSFDISGEEQVSNLLDIITLKKKLGNKVELLFGNHDFHYIAFNERYSGFQNTFQYIFRDTFLENINLFNMYYTDGLHHISHAGITRTWLNNNNIKLEDINELFKADLNAFKFTGFDIYGDSIQSSPIWVRLNSLSIDGIPGTHIVGHTHGNTNRMFHRKDKVIYAIDSLPNQYLIINDKEYVNVNCNTTNSSNSTSSK